MKRLLKIESTKNNRELEFSHKIYIHGLIHHELDFIFKIFNKHNKLISNYKFVYLRDVTINNSFDIWKKISLYKNIVKKYNALVKFNYIFLFWYFVQTDYNREI